MPHLLFVPYEKLKWLPCLRIEVAEDPQRSQDKSDAVFTITYFHLLRHTRRHHVIYERAGRVRGGEEEGVLFSSSREMLCLPDPLPPPPIMSPLPSMSCHLPILCPLATPYYLALLFVPLLYISHLAPKPPSSPSPPLTVFSLHKPPAHFDHHLPPLLNKHQRKLRILSLVTKGLVNVF